jgi:hypothetical protein
MNEAEAALARQTPDDPALSPLADILRHHGASVKNHYDAFAEYVAAAEAEGIEKYPLYKWTRATIEDPEKQAKHLKIFTVHVGDSELYDRPVADALEADLQALVGGLLTRVSKHDTNPANNPQMPEHLRP